MICEKHRLTRRFKILMDDLVDPCNYCGVRELEVFTWMARRAKPAGFQRGGVIELLSCKPGCTGSSQVDPLVGRNWRDDLSKRFLYALLRRTKNELVKTWRDKYGIQIGRAVWVTGPTRIASVDPVNRLMSSSGLLAWSLNDSHPEAISIQPIELHFGPKGASVQLCYGYRDYSSRWSWGLAVQREDEPFIDMIERASEELSRLCDPNAKPPTIQTWAAHGGKPAKPAPELEITRR